MKREVDRQLSTTDHKLISLGTEFDKIGTMKTPADNFPIDIKTLYGLLSSQQKEIQKLQSRNRFLEEKFRLARHKQFGQTVFVE